MNAIMNGMRISLACLLLVAGAPVAAQACTVPFNCPAEMDVTKITCKDEASRHTPETSTCIGHDEPRTPKLIIDVQGFVDLRTDLPGTMSTGVVALALYEGSRDDLDELLLAWRAELRTGSASLRNIPSGSLPLLTGRCASADDPASREFTVTLGAVDADPAFNYESRGFTIRISPEGFENPPTCA